MNAPSLSAGLRLRIGAPGKINLCLFLGQTRGDGRHELVTVFESVSLADTLTLTVLPDAEPDQVVCEGVAEPNLVSRALAGLRDVGWCAPPVRIEVEKRIPVAAGMGGGSADAAAMLRLAPELAPGRPEEVAALAAQLGADVPSQLVPGVVVGTGAGEVVEPFPDLPEHAIVLLPAPVPLATPSVFEEADRLELPRSAADLEQRHEQVLAALRARTRLPDELVVNDLEPAAVALYPPIAEALDAVRAAGADQTILCGSGPTVAGLFWGAGGAGRAAEAAAALAARFPGAVCAAPVQAEFGMPQSA